MKLYDTNVSPCASRVRIAIYAKSVEIVTPPAGQSSAEYTRLDPPGKVPELETGGR
ncbi:MAG: glutathione S-transferase N-terminal domain-containing protein [Myxococcota bacterium]